LFTFLVNCLVIAGAGILVGSLFPVRKLIAHLPPGQVRRSLSILRILTMVFIAGYLGYLGAFWNRMINWPDLIVPGVFFFGACFVWLTSTLALQTATDVRRVALLEKESITDSLTGLYNRRYLDRRLEEEFARAKRYTLPLSILMIDIDHFKRINDNYGHQAGDLVLGYIGKLILNIIRNSDIAARYGGEELLVIAPNTPSSSAVELAERLRKHIEFHELVLTSEPIKQQKIQITVSIGVSIGRPIIKDVQELILEADEALYRAKREGRNRVIMNKGKEASSNNKQCDKL
jgi:diguanylate cyclase (GGDEF)-like protein